MTTINEIWDKIKNLCTHRVIGFFSIGYGIIFIILDKIDYFYQMEKYNNQDSPLFFPESIILRITNLVFSLSLIAAGYFFLHKKKESWYLYNFSFIGILIKYIFIPFIVISSGQGNFLQLTGIHFVLAISGLVFINRTKVKNQFQIHSTKLKYTSLVLLSLSVLLFYGFEDSIFNDSDKKKHFNKLLYRSHLLFDNTVDSCFFVYDFILVLDTLEDINKYSQIQIVQIDSNSNPIYGERLSINKEVVLSDYYICNDSGQVIKIIQEESSDKSDTLTYTYYDNEKIKTITRTHFFVSNYTTIYQYNYFKERDTIFYLKKEDNYYNAYLNSVNDIVKIEEIRGEYSSEIIKNEYNSQGQLIKVNNYKEKYVEFLFYNKAGFLIKKEKNSYGIFELLESKELIVYKKKTQLATYGKI